MTLEANPLPTAAAAGGTPAERPRGQALARLGALVGRNVSFFIFAILAILATLFVGNFAARDNLVILLKQAAIPAIARAWARRSGCCWIMWILWCTFFRRSRAAFTIWSGCGNRPSRLTRVS